MGRANSSHSKCSKRLQKSIIMIFMAMFGLFTVIGAMCLSGKNIAVNATACANSARVVIESISKKVISGSNYRARLPMASTTKVMTAYLACISGKLGEMVKISRAAVGVEGSSIYLREGERVSLRDLTYGLMLRSGNDAATAIAIYLGGSVEGFADIMNTKAKELGCSDTNFMNPHGLHDDNHYTSAYDLAMITAIALQNKEFKDIVSAKSHKIVSDTEPARIVANKNKMLSLYKDATGVKTGYTKRAGRCLVSSAERNGVELVTVVLNVGDMWNESMALLDLGFGKCHRIELVQKDIKLAEVRLPKSLKTILVAAEQDYSHVFMADEVLDITHEIEFLPKLKAPIVKGQIVGKAKIFNQKHLIFETNIYSMVDVNK